MVWKHAFSDSAIMEDVCLSWNDMSNVSAMYDKMSLSVATPFQTWETPSTGSHCMLYVKFHISQARLASLH